MRIQRVLILAAAAVLGGGGLIYAQDRTRALTANDFVEIQQLYAKYAIAIDAGDAEGYASAFIPEGVFNTNVGHDALVKFATTFHAGVGSHLRHWSSNLFIQPTATVAHGQVSLMIVDFATTPATIVRVGTCTDELVLTAQGWRFRKRTLSHPVAPPTPQ